MTRPSPLRTAVFALAALALFSLLFSLAAENGLWPHLPPGALHDTDLWAGLVAGVALLLLLVRGDRSPRSETGTEAERTAEPRPGEDSG